ncbi:hypothetical protein SAY87_013987 [Trapa incisa]|uniref:protein-tyrosine-phosphatase n=1 Tax=Trapa incisa TaxID=236973 RepID=A0AAN7GJ93_9MYRT|nr:hypothetical protein SAY87_013987 [Trapa incisa]
MDRASSLSGTSKDAFENFMDQRTKVYIWDMDETLILLKSLLNGMYANSFNGSKDVKKGLEIGEMWEKLILDLCDGYFFYEQIENFNEPSLDALHQFDDGRDLSDYDFCGDELGPPQDDTNKRKLSYRLRVVASMYEQGLQSIFGKDTRDHWDALYEMTDKYTDGWLSSARSFLEQCSSGEDYPFPKLEANNHISSNANKMHYVNVLVTSGSLIPSLAKCLLFRFDKLIKHADVYSSWDVGKPQCFKWIKEKFNGPKVQFCVIGDGWEECEAAEAMRWPFVKIDLSPSGSHRFPGLTMRTLGYYFSVVYGQNTGDDTEE